MAFSTEWEPPTSIQRRSARKLSFFGPGLCDGFQACVSAELRAFPASLLRARQRRPAALHSLAIALRWACLRTFAPDRRPFIGWDRPVPPLFRVAALGSHGATASAAIGALTEETILERLAPRGFDS